MTNERPRFEVTYQCTDDDWLSWRIYANDYHDACQAAFDRIDMASIDPAQKLHRARLLRVERIYED